MFNPYILYGRNSDQCCCHRFPLWKSSFQRATQRKAPAERADFLYIRILDDWCLLACTGSRSFTWHLWNRSTFLGHERWELKELIGDSKFPLDGSVCALNGDLSMMYSCKNDEAFGFHGKWARNFRLIPRDSCWPRRGSRHGSHAGKSRGFVFIIWKNLQKERKYIRKAT